MRILLAIDGSNASLQACRVVAAYAGDRSAHRITLLNVQRPPLRLSPHPGLHLTALQSALHAQGELQLEDAGALLAANSFDAQRVVRIGSPAETILETAHELDAAMVVMGGGRQGPLGGYAVGSVALRVAPAARCPVVLIGAGVQIPTNLGRTLRVAAPVDGSPEAIKAVQRLADCAGLLGRMHVDLVHFQPGLTVAASLLPPHDDVLQEWSGLESDSALGRPAQVLSAAGIPHDVHRLAGVPEAGIADFARQQGAELIAMGTRGMGAMHHLLLGSVALKTAQLADVPVALMR